MTSTSSRQPDWLHRVRAGEFEAIPQPFTWDQSCDLAHLINGYAVSEALGRGVLSEWANDRNDEAARTGDWSDSALDLWCCLFYEHRRYRHFGEEPTGSDRKLLDWLCAALRRRLIELPADERAALLRYAQPHGSEH